MHYVGFFNIRIRIFYSIWYVHSMKKHMFMLHPASPHKGEVMVACTVIPKKHNTGQSWEQ